MFYTNLFYFDCETSNFCLCKSNSNPFLEPTSTKQWEYSFLLKETTGVFDGARTHDWQVSTDHESEAPRPHIDKDLSIVGNKWKWHLICKSIWIDLSIVFTYTIIIISK